MADTSFRAERNARSRARLERSLPDLFPPAVLAFAMARPFVPPTPRLIMETYWRHHPLRADALARALARRSGTPEGWRWDLTDAASFRLPPAPWRAEVMAGEPGRCCVCGQPVFRLGWHRDLWQDGRPNRTARWHSACVAAWKLWIQPVTGLAALKKRQARRCALSGKRLLKDAEVDHRVPLFQVWRDHRDRAWPDLLGYWGTPNLQVVNRIAHVDKSGREAGERAARRAVMPIAAEDVPCCPEPGFVAEGGAAGASLP